jgi:hypothetical protein
MKIKRFSFAFRSRASILHQKVGNVLRASTVLGSYRIYQEYPVIRVNPGYHSGRSKFDWVIIDLKIVIECHGQQHYKPVTFGKIKEGYTADQLFKAVQHNDQMKKEAALAAGYTYVVVPYTDQDKITEEYILALIEANKNTNPPEPMPDPTAKVDWKARYQEKRRKDEESGYGEQRRQQAREYRKKLYERSKEQRKNKSGGNGVEGK